MKSKVLAVEAALTLRSRCGALRVVVALTAFKNEGVALAPCGFTAKTLWIVDNNVGETFHSSFVPLINGSNTNFSHPFVLTYPINGFPTDIPRPQLIVRELQTFSNGNPHLITQQLWGADFGVPVSGYLNLF